MVPMLMDPPLGSMSNVQRFQREGEEVVFADLTMFPLGWECTPLHFLR